MSGKIDAKTDAHHNGDHRDEIESNWPKSHETEDAHIDRDDWEAHLITLTVISVNLANEIH